MQFRNIKYILLLPIFLLFISCTNNDIKEIEFDNDIEVYDDYNYGYNGIHFESSYSLYNYNEDNILLISVDLRIYNVLDSRAKIVISEPEAFCDDMKLEDAVYKEYSPDYGYKELFEDKELVIDARKGAECGEAKVHFYLVIKDGNSDVKYRVDFKINNVKLTVYLSHDEKFNQIIKTPLTT